MDKLLQSLVETINHINRPKNAIIRIYIEYKNSASMITQPNKNRNCTTRNQPARIAVWV